MSCGLLIVYDMQYHRFKSSKTKCIWSTDSQGRDFESGNLNILSLPGATIKDVYNFVPPINQYCKIILFLCPTKNIVEDPQSTGKIEEPVSTYQALNTSNLKIIFTLTSLVAQTFTTLSNKKFCTRIIM